MVPLVQSHRRYPETKQYDVLVALYNSVINHQINCCSELNYLLAMAVLLEEEILEAWMNFDTSFFDRWNYFYHNVGTERETGWDGSTRLESGWDD